MTKLSCPICKNESADLLYEISDDESARHFIINREKNQKFTQLKEHLAKLWNSKKCQVLKCKNCQFRYANPYIGGDKKFYDLAYERTGYPKWKFEFEETLNTEMLNDQKKGNK